MIKHIDELWFSDRIIVFKPNLPIKIISERRSLIHNLFKGLKESSPGSSLLSFLIDIKNIN